MADAEEVFRWQLVVMLMLAWWCYDTNIKAQAQEKGMISLSCACVYACTCLHCPGLHVGFLCLCLRRTCKPAFCFEWWLIHCVFCICYDWPEWFFWLVLRHPVENHSNVIELIATEFVSLHISKGAPHIHVPQVVLKKMILGSKQHLFNEASKLFWMASQTSWRRFLYSSCQINTLSRQCLILIFFLTQVEKQDRLLTYFW